MKKQYKQDFSFIEGKIKTLFEQNKYLFVNDYLAPIRNAAFQRFIETGFPTQNLELWKNTSLESVLKDDYRFAFPEKDAYHEEKCFHCSVKGLDGYEISTVNGVCCDQTLTKLENGVIFGSLVLAFEQEQELVKLHFGKYAKNLDGFSFLNEALWLDGVFIYIPDNVVLDKPIQMLNVYNNDENLLVSIRNLIIVGENSKISLLHCDDSLNHQRVLSNMVTEACIAQHAEIDYYKLQNINNETMIINRLMFHQEAGSKLHSNQISLNGGILRNDCHLKLAGEYAQAEVSGAYLMDRNQFIDNHVFIHHAVPNCTSNQEFRGVLDDYAKTIFNGHILVDKGAQKTQAQQSCRNMLINDKAIIETQPFLEIYADDVKCSHGASVGQLDNEALFYMRSRGIGEDHARTLLMYAFVAGILDKIKVEPLKERYSDMIKRRLSGNLGICEQCVLECSAKGQFNDLDF